jgi:hypothetical protein
VPLVRIETFQPKATSKSGPHPNWSQFSLLSSVLGAFESARKLLRAGHRLGDEFYAAFRAIRCAVFMSAFHSFVARIIPLGRLEGKRKRSRTSPAGRKGRDCRLCSVVRTQHWYRRLCAGSRQPGRCLSAKSYVRRCSRAAKRFGGWTRDGGATRLPKPLRLFGAAAAETNTTAL